MSYAAQTIQNILAAQGNPDKHDIRESAWNIQGMVLTYWGMQKRLGKLQCMCAVREPGVWGSVDPHMDWNFRAEIIFTGHSLGPVRNAAAIV